MKLTWPQYLRREIEGVKVSQRVADVVLMLLLRRGHVVSYAEILTMLWPNDDGPIDIDKMLTRLRHALPQAVITVRGQGFIIEKER